MCADEQRFACCVADPSATVLALAVRSANDPRFAHLADRHGVVCALPRRAMQARRRPGSRGRARTTAAYHGTPVENVHSILHRGLRNMSGTRHERNGARCAAAAAAMRLRGE